MTEIKLRTSQVKLASACFKHVVISLAPGQEVSALLENPSAWTAVQAGDRSLILNRGDEVSIVSSDGLTKADRATVLKALEGRVWLARPLRMIELQEVALWGNAAYRVVPNGSGFSIQGVRDNRIDDRIFASVEACKSEILRREPVKAA